MRFEGRCPPEAEPIVRRCAEINLKTSLMKELYDPAEIENARITFLSCKGKRVVEVHTWDCLLDKKKINVIKEAVYVSFGEQFTVRIIDGPNGKILAERICFAHEHI